MTQHGTSSDSLPSFKSLSDVIDVTHGPKSERILGQNRKMVELLVVKFAKKHF